MVAATWALGMALGGSHAAASGLAGGTLGMLNVGAVLWATGRVALSGGEDFTLPLIVYAAKFVVLVGLVGAVALIMRPAVLPFLVGFSTSLPVVVGVCLVRFLK
jgi:hypothetical protein